MEVHAPVDVPAEFLVVLDHVDLEEWIVVHGLREQRVGIEA